MGNLGEATQECHQQLIVCHNQVLLYILNITVIGNNSIETRQVPGVMLGYFGDLGIGTTDWSDLWLSKGKECGLT